MPQNSQSICVSGSIFGNFHCSWIIPNFSSLKSAVGEATTSDYFQLQTYSPRWYLCIYPGGKTDDFEGYMSCFVSFLYSRKDEISAKIHSFTLRNIVGKVLWNHEEDGYYDVFHNMNTNGCKINKKRDAIIEELIDDVLIFCANVSYCSTYVRDSTNTTYIGEMTPITKMVENYESFSSDEENVDSAIFVGGKVITVNSVILSARSKVFEAMFENDMGNRNCKTVHILDFDERVITSLIQFIYTGNVNVMDVNIAVELLRAADEYSMDDLMIYCNNYLIANLNEENVIEVLVKVVEANMCNAQNLKTKAMNYFSGLRGLEIIQKHRQLLKTHPDILLDIIEADRRKDS